MSKITLLNIDCMDYMRDLPDKAFDLAIVDPPYGINVANMNLGKGGGIAKNNNYKKRLGYKYSKNTIF